MIKKKSAFTLMELLIVIALIALIAAGLLVLINPMQQFAKSHDAKRKFELDALRKAFEDYYNDKGCYPKPEEVCYDTPQNYCVGVGAQGRTSLGKICHICGLGPTPTAFSNFAPYMSRLPCDPEHSRRDYLYQVPVSSCTAGSSCKLSPCPQNYCSSWYRIYSNLSVKNDLASLELGCANGACGLAKPPLPTTIPYGFDYGVSSPNISLEMTDIFFCFTNSNTCDDCNNDPNCINNVGGCAYDACVANPSCLDKNKIYSTYTACCSFNLICP